MLNEKWVNEFVYELNAYYKKPVSVLKLVGGTRNILMKVLSSRQSLDLFFRGHYIKRRGDCLLSVLF